jgi:hypothetical protein
MALFWKGWALCRMREGSGFESRRVHCPRFYSASNRNEYQDLPGGKAQLPLKTDNLNAMKALCMIVDAPRYVPNTVIRRDLQIPTVKEEIRRYSSQYRARLSAHPNDLTVNLIELPDNRRLRRHLPNDLPTSFLV